MKSAILAGGETKMVSLRALSELNPRLKVNGHPNAHVYQMSNNTDKWDILLESKQGLLSENGLFETSDVSHNG